MPVVAPFSSEPFLRAGTARHRSPKPVRRQRLPLPRATPATTALAGAAVPAGLAALSIPTVQFNAAALLPHVEALLKGPYGAPALALGCAISAGVSAGLRGRGDEPRQNMVRMATAAGQAALGAPLVFGALRAAMGAALSANLLARGIVFGVATLLGAVAGHHAGRVTSARLPQPKTPHGRTYSAGQADAEAHDLHAARQQAIVRGGRMGGLAAGVILGVAAMRI